MCQFISFLHRPDNGDIAVYDLTSHSGTQKKLGLAEPLWCEGHYLPSGEIQCRTTDKNKETLEMCEERLRKRFPTFIDFCVWAMSQEGIISSDGYDLRGLTTLPADVKFPAECGSLDLRGLTTLPADVKFPAECGYLDLSGLTTLPADVKFPAECGYLDLSEDLKREYCSRKSKK